MYRCQTRDNFILKLLVNFDVSDLVLLTLNATTGYGEVLESELSALGPHQNHATTCFYIFKNKFDKPKIES